MLCDTLYIMAMVLQTQSNIFIPITTVHVWVYGVFFTLCTCTGIVSHPYTGYRSYSMISIKNHLDDELDNSTQYYKFIIKVIFHAACMVDLGEYRKEYKTVRKLLVEALMPIGFALLDKFHSRRLLPGESLSRTQESIGTRHARDRPKTRDQLLH